MNNTGAKVTQRKMPMFKRNLVIISSLLLLIIPIISGCKSEVLAKSGDTVSVHYTGRLANDTVFDTSEDGEPIEFTIGQGKMIPGFEQAVIGMKVDETKTVNIPVDQAYGAWSEDLVMEVDRSQLQEGLEPEIGMQLQMSRTDGGISIVTITKITDSTLTIDANHPLAGQDLEFDIRLLAINKVQAGSTSTFTTIKLQEAFTTGKPTLAEFGSGTCIPCKQMKPILEKLSKEYGSKLNVVIVEVYEQRALTQQHEIMAIPTQILFDVNGKEITRHVGFWSREQILTQLNKIGIY
jgi:peptidylprolyl isomerase